AARERRSQALLSDDEVAAPRSSRERLVQLDVRSDPPAGSARSEDSRGVRVLRHALERHPSADTCALSERRDDGADEAVGYERAPASVRTAAQLWAGERLGRADAKVAQAAWSDRPCPTSGVADGMRWSTGSDVCVRNQNQRAQRHK